MGDDRQVERSQVDSRLSIEFGRNRNTLAGRGAGLNKRPLTCYVNAEDGIRTRDLHLGNVRERVSLVRPRTRVTSADALMLATPEYNRTIPGVMEMLSIDSQDVFPPIRSESNQPP
jgi:hypothetical protein